MTSDRDKTRRIAFAAYSYSRLLRYASIPSTLFTARSASGVNLPTERVRRETERYLVLLELIERVTCNRIINVSGRVFASLTVTARTVFAFVWTPLVRELECFSVLVYYRASRYKTVKIRVKREPLPSYVMETQDEYSDRDPDINVSANNTGGGVMPVSLVTHGENSNAMDQQSTPEDSQLVSLPIESHLNLILHAASLLRRRESISRVTMESLVIAVLLNIAIN